MYYTCMCLLSLIKENQVINTNLKSFLRMPAHTHSRGMKNKMSCLHSFQVPNPNKRIEYNVKYFCYITIKIKMTLPSINSKLLTRDYTI